MVGIPEYQVTAAVWIRGILEDEYGVKPSDLDWRSGGMEEPGRHEKLEAGLAGRRAHDRDRRPARP